VELQGTTGSAPAIDRTIGFEEVIKALPNYRVVASEDGDFTVLQGYKVMKGILERVHPRIDAVFAHNDDMAIGAIKAIEEAGLRPGKEILIVSIDAANGAFKAMLEGKLSCTIECNPLFGPQLMKAVQDYMNGKDLPIRMITSEGVFPASTARRDMTGREY
jgi:simple sugar transport system substrate-binding protein